MADAGLIVLGVLTLLIWIFGFIPFVCFHLLRFFNFRFDITLSKRYPQITLITCISLIIWQLMYILEVIQYFFNGGDGFRIAFAWLEIPCNFIFSCSILWRFWLTYYDLQFAMSTSKREWQKFIDTDAQYDNWYFKNRKTYGDYIWTKKRFIIGTIGIIILYYLLLSIYIYIYFANMRHINIYIICTVQ